jgi:hypothetical protein
MDKITIDLSCCVEQYEFCSNVFIRGNLDPDRRDIFFAELEKNTS